MIRYVGKLEDGRSVLGLGLDEDNIEQLKAGHPIKFDGEPYGLPAGTDILIHYGLDLSALEAQVRPGIRADTKIHDETRPPKPPTKH